MVWFCYVQPFLGDRHILCYMVKYWTNCLHCVC
jgi:hypothetical protein